MLKKFSLLVPFASLSTAAGVIILLARWINGNLLLSSPSALTSYGFMAGICYTLATAISFIVLGFFLNRSDYTQNQHKQSYLLYIIKQKLSGMNLKVIRLFYLLTGIELWLIQLISISVLSEIMLNIPVPITLFFIFDWDVTFRSHHVCEKYTVARDFIYHCPFFFTYFYPYLLFCTKWSQYSI